MSDGVERVPLEVTVNGLRHRLEVEPRLLLVDLLREELNLTGTHIGCDTSYCGACTVLLNGAAVKSCTVFAVQAHQGEILTVEGLATNGELHAVQKAFASCHGLQCGYCTPGLLMSTYFLLSKNSHPSDKEIRKAISGNTCRCTGYQNVLKAVRAASEMMSKEAR
jgi:aerobic carbon-monoxide dehydrogenase small subunit